MMKLIIAFCVSVFTFAGSCYALPGREVIFADYFDIPAGSVAGTEVIGKIHLERNKDVRVHPIPSSYGFEIVRQSRGGLFNVTTEFDAEGRLMGVLSVNDGKVVPKDTATYSVRMALKDGDVLIQEFTINIKAVEQTLWELLYERYMPVALGNSRLYGRKKISDREVAAAIADLEANHGRFSGEKCYTAHPGDYPGQISSHNHRLGGTIEYDWIKVADRIGQLGYAYAKSRLYGPGGDPDKRAQLRDALMNAIIAYTRAVPVEGDDVEVDGHPIGKYTGDGFSLLNRHKLAGHQTLTHQWVMTDPLVVPALGLMPDIRDGMARGDSRCREVYDALIRYYQIFTSIVAERRVIDDPDGRWGEIRNGNYSSGAWADANLGHRSRTMLALPVIWADYNRPMTYVPYWYADFYDGNSYEGFSLSPGWSPHGVVADVAHWMTKNNIPTHKYAQSGYQPDGTISHHVGHGTDAAMVAYGFEWLTDFNTGFMLLKGTPYEVAPVHLQFELDRLLDVYPVMFYNQGMDYLVAGRSFLQDMNKFVTKTYSNAAKRLLKSSGRSGALDRAGELKRVLARISRNEWDMTGTKAFWVNEFLVHRHGRNDGGKPFYSSLKLKSQRTVGAEDFDLDVRHSWHMGSGVLQLKVRGDEYAVPVLANFDWHALPGLTEEWRTDPLPLKGGAQASLPGDNVIAGVLADGASGMAIYHHLPRETYSSATAFKSYHFIDDMIFAVGSGINRYRAGQGEPLATFVDQGAFLSPMTICVNGNKRVVSPDESVDLSVYSDKPMWLHSGDKGYVIMPSDGDTVRIMTGDKINVTDRNMKVAGGRKSGFIIAVMHGRDPDNESYAYVMLPNVTAGDMSHKVKEIVDNVSVKQNSAKSHALKWSDGTVQVAFFDRDEMAVGDVTVAANAPAQFMLRDTDSSYVLSVSNPVPDHTVTSLTFTISRPLPAGVYSYELGGIYPLDGETVTVRPYVGGSEITVELPDSRDEAKYNYQTMLYSGAPITVHIPRN